jgi:BolA protein
MDEASRGALGSRQAALEAALTEALAPTVLEVLNESHSHNVPPGSESHFRVTVVSDAFVGERLVGRHRAVNRVAAPFFAEGLHALALHTFTPEEWAQRSGVTDSPACRGGSGR